MLRRLACGCAAVLVLAAPALAASPLAARLARALAVPQVSSKRSAALVVDLGSGDVVYSKNAALSLAPASNEKLAVAYAALARLGPAFRFRTEVLGAGSRDGDVWNGNLVLRGYGDPTLTISGLQQLAAQLRRAGIRRVTGAVVGDESFFDARRIVLGWKPSFYLSESPPLSALSVDRGRVGTGYARRPALVAAQLLRRTLERRGIGVARRATAEAAPAGAFPLALVESEPLPDILRFMDGESDNFTAELVLKELGAAVLGMGTSAAGASVVTGALREAGVPLAGVRVVDGSGLSRSDRLTVRALVGILTAARADPAVGPYLVRSLPVAGVSGTLEDRLRVRPARGHVLAKTGTTQEASALSGYVDERYAFAVVQNGHPLHYWWARTAQDRFALTLAAAR